ncbi:MAG: hypothetical protein K8T20_08430 [Planctomycetes bacterium]|nr:hypothetical protein [Planctomycetota bacterium]
MDIRELLKKTVDQGKWINLRESGGSWIISLDLKGGRKQTVTLSTFSEGGHEFGRLKSKIAPAKALAGERPTAALKMNANLTFGSLVVEGEDLIMQETLMVAETTPAHLLASLQYIGEMADRYEKMLGGGDKH